MKSILILMTDEGGGGHRASASALRDAFLERFSDQVQLSMIDLWADFAPALLSRVPKSYRFLVDDVPWLYRLIYEVGENAQLVEPVMSAAANVLRPLFDRAIRASSPDLIVSVHPLVQGVILHVLEKTKRPIPLVTVVTDLVTIPPVWFDRRAALCFVPSDEGYRLALRAGLRQEQLRLSGLPIRGAFSRVTRSKLQLQQDLGMVTGVPTALIVSGGEGMGRVADISRFAAARLAADTVVGAPPAGQLVIICGRNQDLKQELDARNWPVPVMVKGFVEDIWDYMAASDCVVTKAGPGTIAEGLALGLPLLLTGYIPGQEKGNVPYVLKHGVGAYVEDPWQIAEVLAGWLGPQRATLEQFAHNARALGRPRAASEIVNAIVELL